ncbi:MAG TPA: flagellar protein FliT [Deltaproteobacteria bacterium]|nr:flagellar protein FliT [Deltaproteobacteria bacterium]
MGNDNKENILNLLNRWHSISIKETEALSSGDLESLNSFLKESLQVRSHLEKLLAKTDYSDLGDDILGLLKKLSEIHASLTTELNRGRDELSDRIGNLRKNKTSLNGYKQKKITSPRFMNEHT